MGRSTPAKLAVRAKIRKEKGPLGKRLVAPKTRQLYEVSVEDFSSWLEDNFPGRRLKKASSCDRHLTAYVEHLWQSNNNYCEAT